MDTVDREPEPLRNPPPASPGGPPPPEQGGVRAYTWEWGREEDRGPRLPWIGVFLVIYGALLLAIVIKWPEGLDVALRRAARRPPSLTLKDASV